MSNLFIHQIIEFGVFGVLGYRDPENPKHFFNLFSGLPPSDDLSKNPSGHFGVGLPNSLASDGLLKS